MADAKVGMPTISGVKDSMIDFAVGAGGGILYALSSSFLGSGLVGGLVGAGLAGAVVKGTRGVAIATILGFQTIVGAIGASQAAASSTQSDVM